MGRMTLAQEITVATFTFIGGFLSFLGSSYIVYNIIRWKKYKEDTFHRLLLGLSFCDLTSSVGWMIAPFGAPRTSSARYLSIGTTQSCSVGGFLIQTSLGFILYNVCLSIYYVQLIRYHFSTKNIVRTEYVMHFISLMYGIGFALVPLPLELYNEVAVGNGCWVAYLPQECWTTEGVDCIRGANGYFQVHIWGYILAGGPSILALITIITCNILVYLAVRNMEQRMRRYSSSDAIAVENNAQQKKRTLAIASQATYYVCIFLNTYLWQFAFRILDLYDVITIENESSWTAMILLAQFFSASAGFGFLLTYIRPRYLRCRNRGESRMKAFGLALSFKPPQQQQRPQQLGDSSSQLEMVTSENSLDGSSAPFMHSVER